MRLLPALRGKQEVLRSSYDPVLSFDEFVGLVTQFSFNGVQYSQPSNPQEEIGPQFVALARAAYKSNGVVFACLTVRQQLLRQARFAFRDRTNGRPGNLYTTGALSPLEAPWPNATTGDLIARMEMYSALGGNFFGTNRYGGVRCLRPDWMRILVGSQSNQTAAVWDPDAEVVGYAYQPGGPGSGRDIVTFLPEEIAHFAPIPDPEAQFRGMSPLTPIVREVMADKAATDHKLLFFENGATPNMVVKMDVEDIQQWVNWIRKFSEDHEGVRNAYKTLFLGAGMDATVVGKDFQQMDFKVTQGAGETRIAAALGTPPVVVGLSEGLQGSSLNAGNFEAAMARLRDITIRPLLQEMAGSLQTIIPLPRSSSELWYDDRDIPAFQEDIRKAGERQQADATAISTLIMAGFDPDSVVQSVTSGDLNRLTHTGLTSVQLLPPGTASPSVSNGNGNGPPALTNGNGKRSDDGDEMLQELLRMSEVRASRSIEVHNHMPELEPARVEFHEGALTSHITVEAGEPARFEMAEGAVHVDSPVTVEAAQIHNHMPEQEPPRVDIHERAFVSETTVEPAQVTVEAAQITVEAAPTPDVNVTVEPARVEIPEGAVSVAVEPAQVTVEAPPTPEVHVHMPEQQRPRKATAKREKDGSLTVEYESEGMSDGD